MTCYCYDRVASFSLAWEGAAGHAPCPRSLRPARPLLTAQVNFEYDLWRSSSKDDYIGDGLEKPNGILKPKGFEFEQTYVVK